MIINGEEAYPIKNFPHYFITKTGNLYSMFIKGAHGATDYNKPHKMAYGQDKDGYYRIVLSTNTKHNYKKIHNLMADTFLNHTIDDGLVVNHKDLNKHNNSLDNLELITNGDNIRHYHKNTPDAIAACSKAVICKDTTTGIITEYKSMDTISKALNIPKCVIRNLVLKPQPIIWRYVNIINVDSTFKAIYNGKVLCTGSTLTKLANKLNKSFAVVSYKYNHPKYPFLANYSLSLKSASTIEKVSEQSESN